DAWETEHFGETNKDYTGWTKKVDEFNGGRILDLAQWKNGKLDGRRIKLYRGKVALKMRAPLFEEAIHKDGKVVEMRGWDPNSGQKKRERITQEDGTIEVAGWHEKGNKMYEGILEGETDEYVIKGKFWNRKGEPVESLKEAMRINLDSVPPSIDVDDIPEIAKKFREEVEERGKDFYIKDTDTLYSGKFYQLEKFAGRELYIIVTVKDGKIDGTATTYRSNGSVALVREFKDGRKVSGSK
ncbi:MAG: hypothetical protein GY915_03735, partial [bacterium]|nr:hypothetical protein [bacterium]